MRACVYDFRVAAEVIMRISLPPKEEKKKKEGGKVWSNEHGFFAVLAGFATCFVLRAAMPFVVGQQSFFKE